MAVVTISHAAYSTAATARAAKTIARNIPKQFNQLSAQRVTAGMNHAIMRPVYPTHVILRPAGLGAGPRLPQLSGAINRPAGLTK